MTLLNLRGRHKYGNLSSREKKELDELLVDMRVIYGIYRPIQIKKIIDSIEKAKLFRVRGYVTPRNVSYIDEWDIKHFYMITNTLLEDNNTTMEVLRSKYTEYQEEIEIALSYISGIFKNAKIWKGHIDVLRSYKHQLEAGMPLTPRQTDTLFKFLSRYCKQMVSNQIL